MCVVVAAVVIAVVDVAVVISMTSPPPPPYPGGLINDERHDLFVSLFDCFHHDNLCSC